MLQNWPDRMRYSSESVSQEVDIDWLRCFLATGNPADHDRISPVIEEKRVHPSIEIREIKEPFHPLYNRPTCFGYPNLGVFATQKIRKGEEIGEYVGELYLRSHGKDHETFMQTFVLSEYTWMINVRGFVLFKDAKNIANEMALINDFRNIQQKPNLCIDPLIHRGGAYFGYVALRDIEQDEELLADYGTLFWESFKRRQGIGS